MGSFFIKRLGIARVCGIAAGLTLVFAVNAGASDKVGYEAFSLGEMVVTGSRTDAEGPATVSVITAEDIDRYNATNLGEALALMPGVHFRQGRSKEGHYVTVRGFEQENVLILLDGIPIGVPYEGVLNLTDLPVQNIAEIKVVKGNASVLYGANAMGGVINIITKRGTTDPNLAFSYEVSDYDTQHLSLTHGWKKGPFSYFMGASKRTSDGRSLADTFTLPSQVTDSMAKAPAKPGTLPNAPIQPDSGRRDNSDYEKDSFTFTGNLAVNERNNLGLSFEYYNNEYGVPAVPIYREHKKGFFYFPRYWRYTDWQRYTVNVIGESIIGDTLTLKTRLFHDDYTNTLDAFDDDTYSTQDRLGPPSGESVYDDYSNGAQVQAFWDGLSRNNLSFGLSFKKDLHKESFKDDPSDKFVSHTWSVALEDRIRVLDNLFFTVGASYDLFDKKKRNQAGSDKDPGKDIHTFNPQIGLTYHLSDSVTLFGSAGRKVRLPTMRNLYAAGVIGPAGNPDLKEERTDNYELGTTWKVSKKVTLQAALFHNEVKDLINFDNMLGRFEQYGKVHMTGAEVSMDARPRPGLNTRIGYTWLHARNRSRVAIENGWHDSLEYNPDELPYRPEHQVNLQITQRFNTGLSLNFNGSYVGRQPFYNHADPVNNQTLIAEKKWLDDYFLMNLKVSQEIGKKLQVYVAVENLLDESYENMDMFPGRGRTFWVGAKLALQGFGAR